jgi:hypothetical protein
LDERQETRDDWMRDKKLGMMDERNGTRDDLMRDKKLGMIG